MHLFLLQALELENGRTGRNTARLGSGRAVVVPVAEFFEVCHAFLTTLPGIGDRAQALASGCKAAPEDPARLDTTWSWD